MLRHEERYVRKSDPNFARTQRNAEIRELRREAEEMTAFLATLVADVSGGHRKRLAPSSAEDGRGTLVWKEVCDDQASQRAKAEFENFRLRRAVQEHAKFARGLHQSFLKSSRRLVCRHCRGNLMDWLIICYRYRGPAAY